MFLQLKKTIHDFFSSNLVKLDLDLDPDPDPHKVNADPQPCKKEKPCSSVKHDFKGSLEG